MGTDPGSDIKNDSGGATAVNTSIPWTQGGKPLDGKITAHIDGLTAYAKNQATMSTNMMGEATKAEILSRLPVDATGRGGYPEGVYVRELLVRNASEFMSYLGQLMQTFQNTGSAAQTVADCLGSTDNMSAITMDQVQFALADPNAKRPAGLNAGIGKTYAQSLAEKQKDQGADAPVDLSKSNTVVSTGVVPGGQYVGNQQTVVTTTAPNGDQTVTTTIQTGPGVSITYTTVTVNGVSTTTSSTTTVTKGQGQTTTTTKNEDGSETIDITSDDGSETTSTFDKDGHETSVHSHAPEPTTPGLPKPEDDPYTQASKTAANQPYLSPW
jgi:hypothetical protein